MPNRISLTGALALVLLTATDAGAHVIHVEWKVAAPDLVVVAYFDNDLPAEEAEVTLSRPDGTVVAAGKTSDTGTWKCPAPPPGTYRLVVRAFAGHEKTVSIVIEPAVAAPAGEGGGPPANSRWLILTGAGIAAGGLGFLVLLVWRKRRRGEPLFAE